MQIENLIKSFSHFGIVYVFAYVSSIQSKDLPVLLTEGSMIAPSTETLLVKLCGNGTPLESSQLTLNQAMKQKSLADIYQITNACRDDLTAPKPEKSEHYIKAPAINSTPAKKQIDLYLAKYWKSISHKFWWLQDPSAENATTPLRAIAEVVNGALDSYQITKNQSDYELAIKSAESLISIQNEIATGGFGFPAWDDNTSHLGKLANKFLRHAKSQGLMGTVVRKGWIVDDLGRGDLYFDTGLAGEALIRVYRQTGKQSFLQAAILAGDWAMSKPAVANFNYNAFSVLLLSKLYAQTKNKQYLESAVEKTLVGIYSGMILKGKHAGHWVDAHNQRIVYRQIMLRATIALLRVIPRNHPEYTTLQELYSIAADAMFSQLLINGIANPDSTMLTYCENEQLIQSKRIPNWPHALKSDLHKVALKSLYRNKPFGGPAAVLCFLKDYSLERGYLSL